MKILILGHKGLLGSQVTSYFSSRDREVITIDLRWPDIEFKEYVENFEGVIVNCIGAIPQSGTKDYSINYDLPLFLLKKGKKVLQPDTDCVFSGRISKDDFYSKNDLMDATGPYPESKIYFNRQSEVYSNTLRIIRTSIVGFDSKEKSLLSWFLKTAKDHGKCPGYENHFWNGITTLEWSKIAENIIDNWDSYERLTQVGSNKVTKYSLLKLFAKVFGISCEIFHVVTDENINKCLRTEIQVQDLELQIKELYEWKRNNTSSFFIQ